MQISRAFMAIAMLAKHDGVENINTTQPDGVWRRELGPWQIELNASGEERDAVPAFCAGLRCNGWPCGIIAPNGGAIASVGGASENKLMADIEAEIGMTIEAAMEDAA